MLYDSSIFRVARTNHGLILEKNHEFKLCEPFFTWRNLSAQNDLFKNCRITFIKGVNVTSEDVIKLLCECKKPLMEVPHQTIAAFGVTFKKSELARDEEFRAGGDLTQLESLANEKAIAEKETPYQIVGNPENPAELFLKANKPSHLFKTRGEAGIRPCQKRRVVIEGKEKWVEPWSVHEPEIGIVVNPHCRPVAFTPAIDMSCRALEGIGLPLLIKAKIFERCAGFGDWVTVPEYPLKFWETINIRSWVERGGKKIWPMEGEPDCMSAQQCRRSLNELCMDMNDSSLMSDGEAALFMSGTGIVPAVNKNDKFSLINGDKIIYESEEIGDIRATVREIPFPIRDLSMQN